MQLETGSATLILMRHGETAWNREKRIMGDLDIPLNELGKKQCANAAALLDGFGVDRIVTSPLMRAAQTAEIVASRLSVPVIAEPRLVEVRFGQWQGKTYEEVAADPRYLAFAADPVANPTAGGETAACVQRRGLEALSAIRAGECVCFVTHGDLIRTLLCHFLATPLSAYRRIRTDNAGLSGIAIGCGAPEVKFLNVLADQARTRSHTHWSAQTT